MDISVTEHLKKQRKKAHKTQKINGHHLKMTIKALTKRLKDKNKIIEDLNLKVDSYKRILEETEAVRMVTS